MKSLAMNTNGLFINNKVLRDGDGSVSHGGGIGGGATCGFS